MKQLILKMTHVGEWNMNSYALICPETEQSVLIDPGDDPDKLMTMLKGSRPVAIWLTHTHHDHVGALDEMRQRLKLPVYAHSGEHVVDPQANHWLEHGDVLNVGNHRCEVYHTPGHIGDQICFALQNDPRIIVGDTIFEGGPGKTRSHVDFVQTLNTLRDVVLSWPNEYVCYPGHGPHFVLGDKRANIEIFLTKSHPRNFFGDAVW